MTDKLTQTGSQASQELSRSLCQEQIIIDGVDVDGCKYYLRNPHKSCGVGLVDCEGKDCMFKQLARKTQECEEKDKEANRLNVIIDRLLEAGGYDKDISSAEDFEDVYSDMDYKLGLLVDLKQECKELKKEYEKLKNTWLKQSKVLFSKKKSIEALKKAVLLKENNRYIQSCLTQEKQLEYEKLLNKLTRGVVLPTISEPEVINLADRYRKALEEIEKLINDDEFIKCPIHDDENCNYGTSRKIHDIINKAKGEE